MRATTTTRKGETMRHLEHDWSPSSTSLAQAELEREAFAKRGIRLIDTNTYGVQSSDGKREYTVRYVGCSEDGFANLWECDCPAGTHGKTCKHVRNVGFACGEIFN